MASDRIEPKEIKILLKRVLNAKSVQELDSETVSRQMKKLAETTIEYSENKIPEPAASEIINAFLEGHSGAALCRIVELRSGRSLRDQSPLGWQPVNIENESLFSFTYRNLLSSFINAMSSRVDVCREYISSSCARAALLELKSSEFMEHIDKRRDESPTAAAIGLHLNLMYMASDEYEMKADLEEQLHREGFFQILKELSTSRCLSFPFANSNY